MRLNEVFGCVAAGNRWTVEYLEAIIWSRGTA